MIQGYQDLEVYRRSYRLALEMHRITRTFPAIERYELGSQVRRAAISIVLNIVEGYGRKDSVAEFKHFLRNALGSCNETRVLIDIAADLGYLTREEHSRLSQEYEILGKQIYRLRETWARKGTDI